MSSSTDTSQDHANKLLDAYFLADGDLPPGELKERPLMQVKQLAAALERLNPEAGVYVTLTGSEPVFRLRLTGVRIMQSRTPAGEYLVTLHCEDD